MADYSANVLGEELSRLMDREAPEASLHIRLVRETLGADIADTIRLIDGIVSPPIAQFQKPGIRSAALFQDRWICVLSAGNPLCEAPSFGLDDLARLPWVVPYHRNQGYPSAAPATRQLAALGIHPRIAVRVESYRAVPDFIAGTRRVALLPEQLAARLPDDLGLRFLDCPVPLDPIDEVLWWDSRYDKDPGHVWLRELFLRAAARLTP
jgi:DNA-binding transcriptional LysR family regulator